LRLAPPLVMSKPFPTTPTATPTLSFPLPRRVTLWKQYVTPASGAVLALAITRPPVTARWARAPGTGCAPCAGEEVAPRGRRRGGGGCGVRSATDAPQDPDARPVAPVPRPRGGRGRSLGGTGPGARAGRLAAGRAAPGVR